MEEVKLKPILFNTEMVRAIQGNLKTVTRRILKTEMYIPDDAVFGYTDFTPKGYISCRGTFFDKNHDKYFGEKFIKKPYQTGDILYVREAWNKGYFENSDSEYSNECWFEEASVQDGGYLKALTTYVYRADFKRQDEINLGMKWRPSIHMPKEAVRIFLKVTGIRVERLRDMVLADVFIEGVQETDAYEKTWDNWHKLWNRNIKKSDIYKYGWEANPWVWVIKFEKISKEEILNESI